MQWSQHIASVNRANHFKSHMGKGFANSIKPWAQHKCRLINSKLKYASALSACTCIVAVFAALPSHPQSKWDNLPITVCQATVVESISNYTKNMNKHKREMEHVCKLWISRYSPSRSAGALTTRKVSFERLETDIKKIFTHLDRENFEYFDKFDRQRLCFIMRDVNNN